MIALKFLRRHWGKLLVLLILLYFFLPIDDIEESLGITSGRMTFILQDGRLAPFPKNLTDLKLGHSVGLFHCIWTGSFSATAEVVSEWLKNSPGVQEGDTTQGPIGPRYVLQTKSLPGYIDVTDEGRHVSLLIGLTRDPMPTPHHTPPSTSP